MVAWNIEILGKLQTLLSLRLCAWYYLGQQETGSSFVCIHVYTQIIHVRDSHWCTVSNIGCNDGVVNVYYSLYPSISADTIRLIASLVFSSASQLVIQMDVGRQSNGSDCGELAI